MYHNEHNPPHFHAEYQVKEPCSTLTEKC